LFEDFNICPYTGLRSFTEEESIYFKGRDEHIQEATAQLEKNKFLMLTGASGDGKSSLVYAGIIPNARAGFLKATYSNWQVVDFRPERSPLKNLSSALGKALGIENPETVKAELQHGFSAIIDLFKSSKRYIDESVNSWTDASDEEKASQTRDASNLIILADQFEEFFTNPENYDKGVPSTESALILNLLLETARIALEEGLPIYVVFTMRSDYIGQCAAFRGLPEYIGFSQFFVPRMNRKQLQEVIEEPAVLSGNKITRRLTERLIEDITDGTDQLPMLQHALNQIWKMADSGKEEMDLIHYAMVGGIASNELPDQEKSKFVSWFLDLPEKIKVCYDEANLQNVLNTHANKLNNLATDYVKEHTKDEIDDNIAKLIIKHTFQCLTKINEGRAVRNRMTLAEITSIINKPEIQSKTVNLVLNSYRDHTNTLLKPFIGEENENWDMADDSVLDITHESLIRNWTQLKQWADEELEDYTIFLDFQQQLERWLKNDRSSDFLLSIGPLTYFEDWFNKKQPNKNWVARYEAAEGERENILARCEELLIDAEEFLAASAQRHIITRTVMKYGPRRIAAALAILALLIFSSFGLKNYLERRDSAMLEFFKEETIRFGNSPDIFLNNSSVALMEELRLEQLSADEIVSAMVGLENKTSMASAIVAQMLRQAAIASEPSIHRFSYLTDSLLTAEMKKPVSERENEVLIRESNDLMFNLIMSHYFSPEMGYDQIIERNGARMSNLLKEIISGDLRDFQDTQEIIDLIEYSLNEKALTQVEILAIINQLSPLEEDFDNETWVAERFPKEQIHKISHLDFGFNFNGLYQELGYLYAATGNTEMLNQVIDSLRAYNSNYPNQSYLSQIDNALNIAYYLKDYGHLSAYEQFIKDYSEKEGMSVLNYYQRLVAYVGYKFPSIQKMSLDGFFLLNRYHNLNLDFFTANEIKELYSEYIQVINKSLVNKSEKEFLLALAYKDMGISLGKRQFFEPNGVTQATIDNMFKTSLQHFRSVDKTYLIEEIRTPNMLSNTKTTYPREYLFLYPDIRDPIFTTPPQISLMNYTSASFLNYLLDNGLFQEVYTNETVQYIPDWLSEYDALLSSGFSDIVVIDPNVLRKLGLQISTNFDAIQDQFSFLFLMIGNQEGYEGRFENAALNYQKVNMDAIFDILGSPFGFLNDDIMRRIAHATGQMSSVGSPEIGYDFIKRFSNPINRSQLYAFAAKDAIINDGKKPYVDVLIDSSLVEADRVENTDAQPNRTVIAAALAFRNEGDDIEQAYRVIKNEQLKARGIWWISRGLAFNNDLYGSYAAIPDNLNDDDVCGYLYEVFHDYNRNNQPESPFWQRYEELNDLPDARINYVQ
jgi:energy-coupling factor transporter ATP-binding protein EcfA2